MKTAVVLPLIAVLAANGAKLRPSQQQTPDDDLLIARPVETFKPIIDRFPIPPKIIDPQLIIDPVPTHPIIEPKIPIAIDRKPIDRLIVDPPVHPIPHKPILHDGPIMTEYFTKPAIDPINPPRDIVIDDGPEIMFPPKRPMTDIVIDDGPEIMFPPKRPMTDIVIDDGPEIILPKKPILSKNFLDVEYFATTKDPIHPPRMIEEPLKIPVKPTHPIIVDPPRLPVIPGHPLIYDPPRLPDAPGHPIIYDPPRIPEEPTHPIIRDPPRLPIVPDHPIIYDPPRIPEEPTHPRIIFDPPRLPDAPGHPFIYDLPEVPFDKIEELELFDEVNEEDVVNEEEPRIVCHMPPRKDFEEFPEMVIDPAPIEEPEMVIDPPPFGQQEFVIDPVYEEEVHYAIDDPIYEPEMVIDYFPPPFAGEEILQYGYWNEIPEGVWDEPLEFHPEIAPEVAEADAVASF